MWGDDSQTAVYRNKFNTHVLEILIACQVQTDSSSARTVTPRYRRLNVHFFSNPRLKKGRWEGVTFFARTEKQKTFEIENKLQIMIGDRTTSWEDMQLLLFPTMQCLKKQEVGLEVT